MTSAYESVDPNSRSDVNVYDQILQSPEESSPNRDLYTDVKPANNYENIDRVV